MESVAAVSLACNVVQLLQSSLQAIDVCKRALENSSPATLIDLHRETLHEIAGNVRKTVSSGKSDASSVQSSRLDRLADDLLVISNELDASLVKYRPDAAQSRARKVIRALKYQWAG
jgi:hypothetical protein